MTIQNLYTQYLDGKITQSKFLYEARRDQNLDMISSSNSFDDVVKILKNKSIISEKAHKEAKQAAGKQEVDIIAKTIDMVNPYEYSKGMNYELDIMDVPATSGDLDKGNVLRAQKKVLANLTKDPQYYQNKIHGKGEVTDEWVEATKKEIDKIGKGKPKVIREGARPGYHADGTPKSNDEMSDDEREAFYNDSNFLDEHGQYADRVADVNADSSPLKEKQEAIYKKYAESTGIPMENLMAMVREAKAKKLEEADDTPEEKKAKDLKIAALKADIVASNKQIQDLNQGKGV
jgi:hypothetical protein